MAIVGTGPNAWMADDDVRLAKSRVNDVSVPWTEHDGYGAVWLHRITGIEILVLGQAKVVDCVGN